MFKIIKMKHFFLLVISLLSIWMLLIFTRGDKGNPFAYQVEKSTKIESPFELSNTTSRYALTEAIVEHKTFFLTEEEAKFSAPDTVDYKGKFISIFTPGVSLISTPFYFLGKQVGLPQIFTFFTTAIFAIINVFLVARLSSKLGTGKYTSILSGFVFLFATNALPYSLTLTQHHMSVTFILLSLLNVLERRTFARNTLLGIYTGLALLIDIPNIIMLIPIILYAIISHFSIKEIGNKIELNFRSVCLVFLIGLIPLLVIFGIYNFQTTGSFTKIAQSIGRTHYFRDNLPPQDQADSPIPEDTRGKPLLNLPFETRNQLNGFYTLLISNERSWIYYSPVLLFGILGLFFAYKNSRTSFAAKLAISVISINVIVYSMFGDPWGGWAFGPRYLIPSAAVMASYLGIVIQKFKKNHIFIILFFVLFSYSTFISTLGAITTNAIAPKVEAVNLKPSIPYTYKYNLDFVKQDQSSNLLYNVLLKGKIPLNVYLYILTGSIIVISAIIYRLALITEEDKNE